MSFDYMWTILRQDSAPEPLLSCQSDDDKDSNLIAVLDARDCNFCFPDNLQRIGGYLKELHFTKDFNSNSDVLLRIPHYFSKFQCLECLDLRGNQLDLMQDEDVCIFDIVTLKRLYLARCGIGHLPGNISKLFMLEHLDVEGNSLVELPDELFNIKSLVNLHLSSNNIVELSDKFNSLSKLTKLDLSRNSLTKFPQIHDVNKSLQKLMIWDNNLFILPKTIGNLSALGHLDFSQNYLTFLPESIGDLSNLHFLNCSTNSITSLPESVTVLNLAEGRFLLEHNPLQRPPLEECLKGMETIRGYFAALNSSSGCHSNRAKLILLGESMAGKTSLTTALVHCKAKTIPADARTVGIDLLRWKVRPEVDNLEVLVIDCAGQRKYIITHQFFISQGSLFLLVVDLYRYEMTDACYRQTVGNWIDLILAHVPDAAIIIVPTHLDLFMQTENHVVFERSKHIMDNIWEDDNIRQLAFQMGDAECSKLSSAGIDDVEESNVSSYQLISSHPGGRHISAILKFDNKVLNYAQSLTDSICMVPVSSQGGLECVTDLRDEIISALTNPAIMPLVGREVPQNWIDFEEYCIELRTESPVMEYGKLAEVAMTKFGLTNEMVSSALRYFDTTGSVLYFSYLGGLEKFVFLDPEWFVVVMKKVFCHNQGELLQFKSNFSYKFHLSVEEFDQAKEELLENARLSLPLLRCIWAEIETITANDDIFTSLIEIFDHFRLSIKVGSRDDLLKGDTSLLVPWYLKPASQSEIEMYWPKDKGDDTDEVICHIESVVGPLPVGSFERFVADSHGVVDDCLAWEDALLVIQPDCKVLCSTSNLRRCGKFVLRGRCTKTFLHSLWTTLLHLLKVLEKLFGQLPGLGYVKCRSICPSCISNHLENPHMFSMQSWFTWKHVKEFVPCPKEHVSVPRHLLLPPKAVIESFESVQKHDDVMQQLSEVRAADDLLFGLAELVGLRHMKLGRCLKLSQQKLDTINYEKQNQLLEQTIAMLLLWVQINGDAATVKQLYLNVEDIQPRATDLLDFVMQWKSR